jgi:hypothetical protein
MIKIDALKKPNGITTLVLTSNDPTGDKDKLDLIGAAIMDKGEKRGAYPLSGDGAVMEIHVKDSTI